MRRVIEFLVRVAVLALILFVLWCACNARLSNGVNLSVIVGGVLLTLPLVWFGRKILDRAQAANRVAWITTFVHFALGFTLGIPIVRAVTSYRDWPGWVLPVPSEIGLALVIIWGSRFADSGEPWLERMRCPLFHCSQSEIGGRLAVRLDA